MTSPYLSCAVGIHLLHSAWAALLFYHAVMATVVFRRGLKSTCSMACRGWSLPRGLALSLGCLANGGALLLFWPVAARDPGGMAGQLEHMGLSPGSFWLLSAWYVLVHPVLEELFWRWEMASVRPGPTLGDLAFAGYHAIVLIPFLPWYWVLPVVLLLLGTAVVWRGLSRSQGGLAIAIVSHACAGLGTMVAAAILAGWIGR